MTRNWMTTTVGLIGAVANAMIPLLQNGTVDLQTLLISAIMAALGVLSKDFNITGTK